MRRRGFSLVEVMVAVAIIAIVSGVAGLSLRVAPTAPVTSRAVIDSARHRAIRSGSRVVGRFDSVQYVAYPTGVVIVGGYAIEPGHAR